jgi:hypothetical protein
MGLKQVTCMYTATLKIDASLSRKFLISFPLRAEVQAFNTARLTSLEGDPKIYNAMDKAGCDARGNPLSKNHAARLLEQLVALPELTLKVK